MGRISTPELSRWTKPDGGGWQHFIGMARARDAFDCLKEHLTVAGLMPDGGLMFRESGFIKDPALPMQCRAVCMVDCDTSNHIRMEIAMKGIDSAGNERIVPFATGKSDSVNADSIYRMFRIAAECSLMLNGDGFQFERSNVELVLNEEDAQTLLTNCQADIDELDLRNDVKDTLERVCSQLRGQIEQAEMPAVDQSMASGIQIG